MELELRQPLFGIGPGGNPRMLHVFFTFVQRGFDRDIIYMSLVVCKYQRGGLTVTL